MSAPTKEPDSRRGVPAGIVPRGPGDRAPLSYAQQRLWFLDRLAPGNTTYHLPLALALDGPLDVGVLERAVNEIVRRHESLRTTFGSADGDPVQVIAPRLSVALPVFVCDPASGVAPDEQARRVATEESERPFDLARGPLVRCRLVRLAEQRHVLVMVLHHIVADGWSLGVLLRELATLYTAFTRGGPSPLPELALQYADYAAWEREWLRGENLAEQLAYWKAQLEGAPAELELPLDRPRPAEQRFRGPSEPFVLAAPLAQGLRALGRREGTTLFMTLLAAFQALLYRYTRQTDLVIGTAVANRNRVDVEGLIGLFVNTLALRTDLSGDPTFGQLLRRVREVALAAFTHQDLPFEKLIEELRLVRDTARTPLFQVMFVFQDGPTIRSLSPELGLKLLPVETLAAKFDLILSLEEDGAGLKGAVRYNADLFERATIVRMIGHLRTLLEGVANEPAQPLSGLPLLTAAERRQLLIQFNDTRWDYPRDACIHELFEARADADPLAVAVVDQGRRWSYRALNERANRLAHHLREQGLSPNQRVGVVMDRSAEMISGVLAILKAGGAYVPLDPTDPPSRLCFLLQDTRVAGVLTQRKWAAAFRVEDVPVICIDEDDLAIAARPSTNPNVRATAGDLAYVMYTSGSTGQPKGVEVPHRGVVRLLFGVDYVPFADKLTVLMLAPINFDASTFELWGPLLHGGTCVVSAGRLPDLRDLERTLREHDVNCLWLTSTLFNLVIDERPQALSSVSHLVVGGEALSAAHVRKALDELPRTQIVNGYGPTEGTTFTCCYPIPRPLDSGLRSIPIGRPIANTRVYVLDPDRQLLPVGVPGELYIGGDGLARGYWHQPELTAERFVADPFGGGPGARLYKTGDRCRWRADGTIEFLGRLDHQVKIRGHRTEPGEVEAALLTHPAVREAAVVAHEFSAGDWRLVAYLVGPPALDGAELRSFLGRSLPDYMVPSDFILVDSLTVTPNGKLDRRKLPVPALGGHGLGTAFVAPQTPAEKRLAEIWRPILGCGEIGIHDNFFDLGGHSLLVARLADRAEDAFGRALPLNIVFRRPTLRGMAEWLERDVPGKSSPARPGEAAFLQTPSFFCLGKGPTLASYLGETRVYGWDLERERWTTRPRIDEMARFFVTKVRAIQPHGPYVLGGYSGMGVVAFEAAQQLYAQGQEVRLLVLFDATSLPSRKGSPRLVRGFSAVARARYHWRNLAMRRPLLWPSYVVDRLNTKLLKMVYGIPGLNRICPMPHAIRMGAEIKKYAPQDYPGRVVFFAASNRDDEDSGHNSYREWCERAHGGFQAHVIPGDHHTMFEEPNVRVLIGHLERLIR
ncbi:MAG: amino acid adenylation domain-containing protein [Isosphaeraceae bacterium]|nr:amino acid adenylation domain-containing protein [Isosphaeraceae bacterium]